MNRVRRSIRFALILVCVGLAGYGGFRYYLRHTASAHYLQQRVDQYLAAGDDDSAEVLIRRLLALYPERVDSRWQMIELLKRRKRDTRDGDDTADVSERLIHHLLVLQESSPPDQRVETELYAGFTELGRSDRARDAAVRAWELGSREPRLSFEAAIAAFHDGQIERSRQRLQSVLATGSERRLEHILLEVELSIAEGDVAETRPRVVQALKQVSTLTRHQQMRIEPQGRRLIVRLTENAIATAPDLQDALLQCRRGLGLLESLARLSAERTARIQAASELALLLYTLERRFPEQIHGSSPQRDQHYSRFESLVDDLEAAGEAPPLVGFVYAMAAARRGDGALMVKRLSDAARRDDSAAGDQQTLSKDDAEILQIIAAESLLSEGSLRKAEQVLSMIPAESPLQSHANLLRSQIAFSERRFKESWRFLSGVEGDIADGLANHLLRISTGLSCGNWQEVLQSCDVIENNNEQAEAKLPSWLQSHEFVLKNLTAVRMQCLLRTGREREAQKLFEGFAAPREQSVGCQMWARHLLESGESSRAAQWIRRGLLIAPDDFALHCLLSEEASVRGDDEQALSILKTYALKHRRHTESQLAVAVWHHRQGATADAIRWLESALEAQPASLPMLSEYAGLLLSADRTAQAAAVIDRIAASDGGADVALLLRARSAMKARGYEAASEMLQRLQVDGRRNAHAQLLQGELFLSNDSPVAAASAFAAGLGYAGAETAAREGLIRALEAVVGASGLTQAEQEVSRLLEEFPDEPVLVLLGAQLAADSGQLQRALDRVTRLEELQGATSETSLLKVDALLALERFVEAEVILGTLIAVDQRAALPHLLKAKLHHLQGQHELALQEIRIVASEEGLTSRILQLQLEQLDCLDRSDRAIELLREYVGREGAGLQRVLELSSRLRRAGRFDEALKLLDGITAAPRSTDARRLDWERLEVLSASEHWEDAHRLATQVTESGRNAAECLRASRLFLRYQWFAAARLWAETAREHLPEELRFEQEALAADVEYAAAKSMLKAEQLAKVAQQYELLLESDPQRLAVLNNLTWIYAMDLRQPAKALKYADQLMTASAGEVFHPMLADTLVRVYLEAGEGDSAQHVAQMHLQARADDPRAMFLNALVVSELVDATLEELWMNRHQMQEILDAGEAGDLLSEVYAVAHRLDSRIADLLLEPSRVLLEPTRSLESVSL